MLSKDHIRLLQSLVRAEARTVERRYLKATPHAGQSKESFAAEPEVQKEKLRFAESVYDALTEMKRFLYEDPERRPFVLECIVYFLGLDKGWVHTEHDTLEFTGKDCWIWIKFRPEYCDRGLLHVAVEHRKDVEWTQDRYSRFNLDAADMWPRLFFHPDTAWKEIRAWLTIRNQWPDGSNDSNPGG